MEPLTMVRRCLVDASRLARAGEQLALAQRSRFALRVSELQAEHDAHVDTAADHRFRARLWSSFSLVPGASYLSKKYEGRCRESLEHRRDVDQRLGAAEATIREVDAVIRKCRRTLGHLGKATRALEQLGIPPRGVVQQAVTLQAKCAHLLQIRRSDRWYLDALSTAQLAVGLVRDWAQAKVVAEARIREAAAARPAIVRANGQSGAGRIFLPIPTTLGSMAARMGAFRDDQTPNGASPWFVTRDMNLAPFKDMLPLAYRPTATPFEYFPIPIAASSQNLWGLMDKESWGHIRKSVYASSGHRCVICGGRGKGFIADAVSQPGERRQTIEAHEVWEWNVPDQRTGIGVQSLRKMLSLCPNCHGCFHEAAFGRLARVNGLEMEVREAIEKRRMLINRVGQDELSAQIQASTSHLKSVSSIDTWIVDLNHLAGQQYMAHASLTMIEGNRAGLMPERIAGIDFTTDSGREFSARSAQAIVAELTDALEQRWEEEASTVVPFRRR